MKQKNLSKWLKWILVGLAICGLAVYGYIIPVLGNNIARANPEFAYCYSPWLFFLLGTALPVFAALVCGWTITSEIACDRSFSNKNAKLLKVISFLAAGDAVYFFLGNIVFLSLDMNHPGIVLASLFVVFAGAAIAVAAATLSHLVYKAAQIQAENEGTI